jgi:hypothetical protein
LWRKPFFAHVVDAEGAELMACRRGLLLAEAETDSVGLAAKLQSMDKERSFHSTLVKEINFLLRSFSNSLVRLVRRSAYGAAHLLAKLGCDNKICNDWFGVAPICIENQVVMENIFD